MSTWTLVSRATGLARVVAIGAVLGPTFLGNLFQSTNMLPNLAYEVLTGSLFASILVPPLVRALDRGDDDAARRIASGFLGAVLLVFACAAALIALLSPVVLRLLTLGVDDPTIARDQQRIGVLLLVLVMPQLLLYAVAGTCAAAMNAKGRFALAAGAPALENVGLIVTLGVFAAVHGVGQDVSEFGRAEALLLGGGATAAVALHAAVQWFGARRAGMTLVPSAGWRDPEVRAVLRTARPSLGYSGLNTLRVLLVLVVANSVAGGVVAFDLALNFVNVVTALAARPVATALLPQLARLARVDDAGFLRELQRGTSVSAAAVVPAALCLITLAPSVARAVTFGEMGTERGVALVTVSLAAVALSAVGDSGFVLATSASYARQDARAPFHAMVVRVAVSATGMAVAFTLDGTAVLLVLGASLAAGDLASGGYLWRRLLRALPGPRTQVASAVRRGVLTGAAAAAAGGMAGRLADEMVVDVAPVLIGGLASLLALVVAHALLRSPELAYVRSRVGGTG